MKKQNLRIQPSVIKGLEHKQQLNSIVSQDDEFVLMQDLPHEKSILPKTNLGTIVEQVNGNFMQVRDSGENAPAALRSEMYNAAPVFLESSPGTITVTHREMIAAVNGTANIDTFPMNFRIQPCNKETFPWLHKIANLFETYTFTKLKFIYVPRVPTSYAGQIGLAIDFDADDLPVATLNQFASYRNNVIGSIWSGVALGVEGEALQKCVVERYTDHMAAHHAYDPILHDVGNLRIAVLSPADTSILGQIYVEYTIILRTPEPPSEDAESISCYKFVGQGTCHLDHPLGTDQNLPPTVSYTNNDIPLTALWHSVDSKWHLNIARAGKYAIWIRYDIDYLSTDWDTTTKCGGNVGMEFGIVGYGCIDHGYWPFDELKVEVSSESGTPDVVHLDMQYYVEATTPDNYVIAAITPPGTAGITNSSVVESVYFVVREVPSFPIAPTFKGKKEIKFPTLTNQQRSHPLNSIWSDAMNEAYALARPAMKFLYNRYAGGSKKKKKMKNRKNLASLQKHKKKNSKK